MFVADRKRNHGQVPRESITIEVKGLIEVIGVERLVTYFWLDLPRSPCQVCGGGVDFNNDKGPPIRTMSAGSCRAIPGTMTDWPDFNIRIHTPPPPLHPAGLGPHQPRLARLTRGGSQRQRLPTSPKPSTSTPSKRSSSVQSPSSKPTPSAFRRALLPCQKCSKTTSPSRCSAATSRSACSSHSSTTSAWPPSASSISTTSLSPRYGICSPSRVPGACYA